MSALRKWLFTGLLVIVPGVITAWEIGLIAPDGEQYLWQIRPTMEHANDDALRVGLGRMILRRLLQWAAGTTINPADR